MIHTHLVYYIKSRDSDCVKNIVEFLSDNKIIYRHYYTSLHIHDISDEDLITFKLKFSNIITLWFHQ